MRRTRAAWSVAALLAAGVALRLSLQWPLHRYAADGDCVLTAFGAWEILAGDLRLFVATGVRQGALGSYLAAAAAGLVGPGRAALALEVVVVGVLQLFVWWRALLELTGWGAREAGSARLLAFVVLPSPAVVYWGIYWPTGYPETVLAATLVIWAGARYWRRGGGAALFALGLACGFAFWMSMLTLAVTLPVLVWLVWQRRAELLSVRGLAGLAGGAGLGALPWILFNLRYGWVSLKANWAIRPVRGWEGFAGNLRRLFSEVVPTLFTAAEQKSPMPPLTAGERLSGWVALALAGVALTALGVALHRRRRGADPGPATRDLVPLVALAFGVAATTVLLFLFSAAASVPGNIVRYVMPAFLVWPLVVALAWEVAGGAAKRVLAVLAVVLLGAYAAAVPWPWTAERAALRSELARDRQIVERLRASGVEAVFGSYWESYPLIFESGGSLGGSTLEPGFDFHGFARRLPEGPCHWALVSRSRREARRAQRAGFAGELTEYPGGRWLFVSAAPARIPNGAPTCREVLGKLRKDFHR